MDSAHLGGLNAAVPVPFGARLRRRAVDHTVLANPPVAAIFCLFRWLHLIAPEPYWLYIGVVAFGGSVSVLSAAWWAEPRRRWHLNAHIATNMAVIALVAYSTGWGSILSIGFLFGAASALQIFGSKAMWPCLIWTALAVGLGQLAIALHLAPTLIHAPLVQGVAGLSLLGALLVIDLLGRATSGREAVEAELRQSERRFKALVSNATDIIIVTNREGTMKYVSPAFERVLGRSAEQYKEESMGAVIHPADLERMIEEFPPLLDDPSRALRTLLRIQDNHGRWRHFEATITNHLEDPDVRGVVGNLHDITDLREAHERFRSAFEDAPIGMALSGVDGTILRANRAYGEILGRGTEELIGLSFRDFTGTEDWERNTAEMQRVFAGQSDSYELETRYLRSDGREVWASVRVSCVRDAEHQPLYLIAQIQDVTEQRRMQQRLAHAAIHDPLTGLPNRVLFMDRLNVALNRSARSGRRVAVAFLDLDRFKLVNDGLGHAAGDDLLRAVAARLQEVIRVQDTVARFGGDEFTILWEEVADQDEALEVARRLLAGLQSPFELDDGPVFVTASIGVVLSGDETTSPSSMLRDADTAMYLAKEGGRGRVEVFDGTSHAVALESLHVINELHNALSEDQLRLHYQAIVDLDSEAVVAVEALLRWQHPVRGLLAPAQFIALAEDCGLIVPIGAWVLHSACHQAAQWFDMAGAHGQRPLEVHVNISPRQLTSTDFVDTVAQAVDASGLPPSLLCLEITERTLMRDEQVTAEALRELRSLGVRVSVDDFGTGYSSLSYLKRFPIDSLKVDQTFVDGLGEDPEDSAIVHAVIALAHSLGLTAVAEGVETEMALEELRRLHCDRAQGFLFARPQPPEEIGEALREALRQRDPDLEPFAVGPARPAVGVSSLPTALRA